MKDLPSFDLNLLVAFHALMIERNVSRAADRIGLAQSSMSNALNRLRDVMDDPLFVRAKGRMHPTDLATKIAPDVALALTAIRRTINHHQVFDPATSEFEIRLATSDYFEFVFLPDIVELARIKAPGMSIRTVPFNAATVGEDLERNEFDLAVGSAELGSKRFKSELLVAETLVCVCSPDHPIVKTGLDLEAFIKAPQIMFSIGGDGTGMIDQMLEKKGLSRNVVVTTSSLFGLARLAANADLIAVTTRRLAARLQENAELEILPLPIKEDTFTFSVYWEVSQPKAAERQFIIDIIAEAVPRGQTISSKSRKSGSSKSPVRSALQKSSKTPDNS